MFVLSLDVARIRNVTVTGEETFRKRIVVDSAFISAR